MTTRLLTLLTALALPAAAQADLTALSADALQGGNAAAADGGVAFTFDMGTERVNWNHARWAVQNLDKPADLSGAAAIELTATADKPRTDTGVYLALKEADGSWYYHPHAVDLTQESNTAAAYLDDFTPATWVSPPGGGHFDENSRFDRDAIAAVAIGVVNPEGIGEVSFTITKFATVAAEPGGDAEPAQINVTGQLLDINGTTAIPAGVFGGYNLKNIATSDERWVTVDGKKIPVKDGKVTVDGKDYEVDNKGRVKIGRQKLRVEAESMPRTRYYRLAMDKAMHHAPVLGSAAFGTNPTWMLVHSVGDRTGPSPYFTNPNWKKDYEQMGAKLGEQAKQAGKTLYIEWWNEPYLNWANINRKNFDPKFFDQSKAKEGGPVHVKHSGEELPHLKWTKDWTRPRFKWYDGKQGFRRGKDDKGKWTLPYAMPYSGWYPTKWRQASAELNPPDNVKDGETYEAGGKTWTAFTPWAVYDATQFTFWSGEGMLRPYLAPGKVFADAAKKAGGEHVEFIIGWGHRPSEDRWAGFTMLYQPTIDLMIASIDGVNEHDYGGGPTKMAANHEFITAYSQTQHGKWLYSYNTESGASSDPQAYGDAADQGSGGGKSAKAQADLAKFRWVAQKVLHTLEHTPDKTRAIAHFGIGGPWWSDEGEGVAFEVMKNLRGRLVQVEETADDLYVVAAIDGSDPQNPRPAGMEDRQELVVAVANAGDQPRDLNLTVAPPPGTSFAGEAITRTATPTGEGGALETREQKGSINADGGAIGASVEPLGLVVITLPLKGELAADAPAAVTRTQAFGDAILANVTPAPGGSVSQTVEFEADTLRGATRAWLRLVVEGINRGEAEAVVNGKPYELPGAVTPENEPTLLIVPIDPADLKPTTTVEYRVKDETRAGYLLAANGVMVEGE